MKTSSAHGPDVVLVNPGGESQIYQSLASSLTAREPPVWAGLMATFVRQKNHSCALVDANALGLGPDETASRIVDMNPRLVAIVVYGHQPSASTQHMPAASAICAAIKRVDPERPILLVGGHVAALPEQSLRDEAADFVCRGEGMFTLTALVEALAAGGRDFDKVPDLLWRDGDRICASSASAPLLMDLDQQMPGPAWDMLPMDKYRAHNWHCFGGIARQPYASLYTTLGCPYRCTFCCIQAPFKNGERQLGMAPSVNSYRAFGPRAVVDQLELLADRYGVRNIKIADEMFVLHPSHVNDVCDLLIERGLDLNIWAYARVDTVRDDMPDKLRKAGFTWLAFGIEAASKKVRDGVNKGFDQDDITKTLERVRAAGIHVIANYIFGLPDDDMASMQQTLDLAVETNAEFANFYCAMAYPGSPLFQLALREKWPLPATWSGYSQHSADALPLPTRHLPAADVLRFRDLAFTTYFTNPRYLDMVAAKFGPASVAEIHDMTAHKLVRKNG